MATSISAAEVETVIFACAAGMGSSVMGVSALKKKLRRAGVPIEVVHRSVGGLPADARLVVTHRGLAELARSKAPDAVVIAFSHFLSDPVLDRLVDSLAAGGEIVATG